jgi:putative PIN family toxin of toxin-antitoxin system
VSLKAVVDTNLFVSASILHRGAPHDLLAAWERNEFLLLISGEQSAEIGNTLRRPRFARYGVSPSQVESLLRRITRQADIVSPIAEVPLPVRDLKDEPILAAALGGDADYLVTGDADLLVLDGDPRLGNLRIVTAREFLDMLGERFEEEAQDENA